MSWIRRTRIEGDNWDIPEVPLGEEREQYLVQVLRDGRVLRENFVDLPYWSYETDAVEADGPGPVTFAVAQVSARFGPGPAALKDIVL
ncbi:hypothetical protein [Poseidonocella pacifica]|uniref:hypothetical protein n=1 Tax=Poseidonocella pacifica TaxID=871651 RepID=UPI000B82F046|nr:hypothetical protein [Poseidonocella pacifica]